jgi:putative membrane protein
MMNNASMHKVALGLIALSLGLACALASAQETGSRPTREYAQASASSDQFEILAAETALTQSTNADVRAFATRMLQDHQQLGKAVRDAATQSGLKPPEMAMSADQAQLLEALQGVTGKDFDTLYFKQQMLAHSSALVVEQMYAKSGDDPNLRQVAASAVPMIVSHADMAKQAATKLGSQ